MTDHDPFDRDELVAAYRDGEATPTERAVVEADPDLIERATILRQVADLVAEPVLGPPPEVKRAHIAAALAISATAPNVRALATKRRRMDITKVASIAAAVIAVLAVPIILLTNADDNNDVTAVAVSDASAAQADNAEEAEPEPASEPELANGESRLDSPAAADAPTEESALGDGGDATSRADEPAAAPASEAPAPTPGVSSLDLYAQAPRRDLGLVANDDELVSRLLEEIDSDADNEGFVGADDQLDPQFACILDWLGDHATDVASAIAIGSALLDGNDVTYVALNPVADVEQQRVVVFAATCEVITDIIVN